MSFETELLEQEYTAKFIEALNNDIRSGKHASEVNSQVLGPVEDLLQNHRSECSLNIGQIMIGAMNMALSLQNSKYGNITPKIGNALYNKFLNEGSLWFTGYNELLDTPNTPNKYWQIAISVIERAAKSPLFVTPCFSHSIQVYFEYLQKLDSNFIPPKIPMGNTFGHFNKEQCFSFNTAYSPTLLNLSLFAVKKNINKLNLNTLPEDLANQVQAVEIFNDANETNDEVNNTSDAVDLGNQNNSGLHCVII